jgi:SPX domain protein involved in polyphosphate accumulation
MRFGKNLSFLAIPEWKQCYLDYEHLKIFISLIK